MSFGLTIFISSKTSNWGSKSRGNRDFDFRNNLVVLAGSLVGQASSQRLRSILLVLILSAGIWGEAGQVMAQSPAVSLSLEVKEPWWTYWMVKLGTVSWTPVPLGRTVEYQFRIRNQGSTIAHISGLEISGVSAGRFNKAGLNAVSLMPQQAVEFALAFTPAQAGSTWATLKVVGPDGVESLLTRTLEGRGKVARVFQLQKPEGFVWRNDEVVNVGGATLGTSVGESLGLLKEIPVSGLLAFGGPAIFQARLEGRDAAEFEAVFYDENFARYEPQPNLALFDFLVSELYLFVGFMPTSAGAKEAWLVIEELPQSGQFETNTSLRLRLDANGLAKGKPNFVIQPKSAFEVSDAVDGFQAVGSETFRATIWREGVVKGRMNLSYYAPFQLSVHEGWSRPAWGRYRIELANDLGRSMSKEFWIGQVTDPEELFPARFPAGHTGKVRSKARAPALKFQWMRDGVALVNGEKYAGATSRELSVKKVTDEDAGQYVCRLTMPSPDGPVSIDDRPVPATVYQRPEVKPFSLRPTQVFEAHAFSLALATSSETEHRFRITGLPPGLSYNQFTGEVIGRIAPSAAPLFAKDYEVTVWATNPAGTSEPFVTTWRVEPYTFSGYKGTYEGLFTMREKGQGGKVRLSMDGKGGFTGKVWRPLSGETRAVRGFLYSPGVAGHSLPIEGAPDWPMGMVGSAEAPIGAAFFRWVPSQERIELLIFSLLDNQLAGAIDMGASGIQDFFATKHAVAPVEAAGVHHLQIGRADWMPGGQNLSVPGGTGFARVWLGRSGAARWAGRLGDSSLLTGSAGGGWIPGIDQWMIPMRHGRWTTWGEAQGWVAYLGSSSVSLAGKWQWKKMRAYPGEGRSVQQRYAAGFWLPDVLVEGSRFEVPVAGDLANGWSVNVTGAEAVVLGDSAGWSTTEPETAPVLLRRTGQMMMDNLSANSVPWQSLVGRLVPKTGLVRGSFVLQNGGSSVVESKVSFEALWMPHLGRAVGLNWMTLPSNLVPSSSKFVPIVAGPLELVPVVEVGGEEIRDP